MKTQTVMHTGNGKSRGATDSGDGVLQLVSFHLAGEEFGLDIQKVREIIRMQALTRVPNAPDFIEGVLNLRGKVVPVIGLRGRLGLERRDADNQTRIVVVEINGIILGLVVDSVSEVLRISENSVEPPPRLCQSEREYISGVGKLQDRLMILFDVDRLLNEVERIDVAGGIQN